MNTPKKITAGTVLYRWKNGDIFPVTVSKVGRKYFYVEGDWEVNGKGFDIESLKYTHKDYGNTIQLYRTAQEILDIQERSRLAGSVRKYFNNASSTLAELSIEKLRAIAEVIKTGE